MKSRLRALSIAVAVLVLVASALAQKSALQAAIPFEFTLDHQTLEEGEYCISTQDSERLSVARIDGHNRAEVKTVSIPGASDPTPRLVFHRYGDQYFLAQVWFGKLGLGHQLYVTPAELAIARRTKQDSTTILAKQLAPKYLR